VTIVGAANRPPRAERIKKIEAILWEIKYLRAISEEKKEFFEFKSGKTDTIFNSKLTHRKNKVCDENAVSTLNKSVKKNPNVEVKNIINLQKKILN